MASPKRKRLTIETKVSIIEEVEKKQVKNAEICRRFDIPSSTLYTILKNKDKIEVIEDIDEPGNREVGDSWSSPNSQTLDEDNFCFLPSSHDCQDRQAIVVNDHLLQQVKTQQHVSCLSCWKCQHKECPFRAMFNLQHKSQIKTFGVHSHTSEPGLLLKWKVITSVKKRLMENPQCSPKEAYDVEVEKQFEETGSMSQKFPSYNLVKYHLYHSRKSSSDDFTEEEDMNLPSIIEEVAQRDVTEEEREFLEDLGEQPEEISGMNLSLLTPKVIKSKHFPDLSFYFAPSRKGKRLLVVNDFTFHLNTQKSGGRMYWKCTVEPCGFRIVYNQEVNDIVKVTGKHTHMTNIHQLRIREFVHLLKTRLMEDSSLTPKSVYEEELQKMKRLENGTILMSYMPSFSSIRTSLYNVKNKKSYEASNVDLSNNSSTDLESEKSQDISPKAITHLSLEDNENMDYENDDRESSSHQALSSALEIATPSLYDSHDIIDQLSDGDSKERTSTASQLPRCPEELEPDLHGDSQFDLSSYSFTFVPTNRGGQALVVNDCVLRSSFMRDPVTYWRCQGKDCPFKCSYDNKTNRLLRVSGKHNHSVNPWNVHIRSFVRRLKKRMCQEIHLPSRTIYEQEILRLRKEGKKEDFLSKLPSFESLKSALYKVKRLTDSSSPEQDNQECPEGSSTQKGGDMESSHGTEPEKYGCSPSTSDDPPEDSVIETLYGPLNTYLTSWLGEDPERKVVDGHLLTKKSSTDNSTGWTCSRRGCLFRCVIDNESKTVLKGKWYHSHRSEVRHLICQTVFNAVKRRACLAAITNPKLIYHQERKRMEKRIAKNPALLKFLPSYAQVHQLILKTRVKQSPINFKQEKLLKFPSPKESVIKNTSEFQNLGSANNEQCKESEKNEVADNCHDESSKLTSYRFTEPFQHDQRTTSHNEQKRMNSTACVIDGMACVDEMEPTFGYEHHSLHQLAEFDYPIGESSGVHSESFGSQPQSLGTDSIIINQAQELVLNNTAVINTTSLQHPVFVGSQLNNTKHDYLAEHSLPPNCDFQTSEYNSDHLSTSARPLNVSSQFIHMAQDTRVPLSSVSQPPQPISSIQSNHLPHHPHDQTLLAGALGTDLKNSDTTSVLQVSSFSVPSSASLPSSSSTSLVSSLSSQQRGVQQLSNIPQLSSVDRNVFILHGYPVFPASAQAGHIYWQCRVSGCHFQCVCNVGTGQVVQISGNHNHEPSSSQQALSSQVTKMLLRKAVEDFDKPLHTVYMDYLHALRNVLDSDSIFNGLPRYDDVAVAMQNARAAMGISSETDFKHVQGASAGVVVGVSSETDPKQMMLQNKDAFEDSPQTVQIHGTEAHIDFALDSERNHLILDGEEMFFMWRKNEFIHWKCKNPECRFKCVYDEENQSLHVLNSHSSHCSSKTEDIQHGPAIKRRYSEEPLTRPAKCPRFDQ